MSDANKNPSSPVAEVEALHQLISDLTEVLKAQREALKEQGFRLPPRTTTTLKEVADRLNAHKTQVAGLQRERDRYRALADTAALVNSSLDLNTVLEQVMDTIVLLTGAERGYLMLRNSMSGRMELMVARNVDRSSLEEDENFEVSRSVVQRVALSGEPLLSTNAQEDTRFSNAESIASYSLRSILCVPLNLRGTVTGVIYTDNKIQEGMFDEATRDLLMAFANQAAVALENARLFTRLQSTLEEISGMKNLQDNIFASIPSGVITTDDEDHITLISTPACEILGVRPEDAAGRGMMDVLPMLDPRFDLMMSQARDDDQQLTGIEFDVETDSRGMLNLVMNFSPLKNAHDQTQGVAIVIDDATAEKAREAQIAGVRRYLPTEVVDGIRSAEELRLGGTGEIITILFGDIRGFSTFSEHMEPEKLVEIINTYMTIASDSIHMHNGVIDKFMGDAVMALYNTPLRPQADHAMRGIRSALAMVDDFHAFHATAPLEDKLTFGIGIHTGRAVVGNVGSPERLDYTAMGDSVNLAKRLQEIADPMQVLISDDTYQLVKDHVEVRELEPIQVKGRSQYTKVYELLRLNPNGGVVS
jgi:PAS domain S-box-containing protein